MQDRLQGWLSVLGLGAQASREDIRDAHRDLAKVWHPDRFSEPRLRSKAEQKLKEINAAYDNLRNYRSSYEADQSPARPSPRQERQPPAASPPPKSPRPPPPQQTRGRTWHIGLVLALALLIIDFAPWRSSRVPEPLADPLEARDPRPTATLQAVAEPDSRAGALTESALTRGTQPTSSGPLDEVDHAFRLSEVPATPHMLTQQAPPAKPTFIHPLAEMDALMGLGRPNQASAKATASDGHTTTARPPDVNRAPVSQRQTVILPSTSLEPTSRPIDPVERLDRRSAEPTVGAPYAPMSLPSGTSWDATVERGLGSLRVENGTKRDAVAVLFDDSSTEAGEAQRAIYVRAGEEATIEEIAPRTYTLRFLLGLDWDDTARGFRDDPKFSEFVKPLRYAEKHEADRVGYSEQRVTLHPVPEGTARTKAIDATKFDLSKLVRIPPVAK